MGSGLDGTELLYYLVRPKILWLFSFMYHHKPVTCQLHVWVRVGTSE